MSFLRTGKIFFTLFFEFFKVVYFVVTLSECYGFIFFEFFKSEKSSLKKNCPFSLVLLLISTTTIPLVKGEISMIPLGK